MLKYYLADILILIPHKIAAEATVTRKFRTKAIQRKRKFIMNVECLMKRELSASSTASFTVASALVTANEEVWS